MSRVVALLLLLLLLPLWLLIAFIQLLVFSKVFFTQKRIGKDAHPFMLFKFQSLKGKHYLPAKGEEIPKWGQLLRATSLDELPQLLNILKGDMLFIGPRPLLLEYLALYSVEQARRHKVKPGLTGWAQVNGRNNLSWEEQFALDVWYVDNRSFWLDVKIVWFTLQKLFTAQKEEIQIREPFKGKVDEKR